MQYTFTGTWQSSIPLFDRSNQPCRSSLVDRSRRLLLFVYPASVAHCPHMCSLPLLIAIRGCFRSTSLPAPAPARVVHLPPRPIRRSLHVCRAELRNQPKKRLHHTAPISASARLARLFSPPVRRATRVSESPTSASGYGLYGLPLLKRPRPRGTEVR